MHHQGILRNDKLIYWRNARGIADTTVMSARSGASNVREVSADLPDLHLNFPASVTGVKGSGGIVRGKTGVIGAAQ